MGVPLPPHDLSALGLVLQADPVVQGVMLLLASVACWALIIEKTWTLGGLRRQARALGVAVADERLPAIPPAGDRLCDATLRAGLREWRDGRDEAETRGEYRDRLERAMRAAVATELRRAEGGLPLLATVGSVAPFVGLFGTVWGIMNSFSGIAASNDTSLAVVAPGIAEALFATAIGLVAAIPAGSPTTASSAASRGSGRRCWPRRRISRAAWCAAPVRRISARPRHRTGCGRRSSGQGNSGQGSSGLWR